MTQVIVIEVIRIKCIEIRWVKVLFDLTPWFPGADDMK